MRADQWRYCDLARRTSRVERPKIRRRTSRSWCRRWEERVWRGAAVETVNETVVGDGRRMERWGSIIEYSNEKFSLCFLFAND